MTTYIALLRKEKGSDYGVDFPDFPGCVTAGKTLEEAKSLAQEALQFHIDGLLEDGYELPNPMSIETIQSDSANDAAVPFLVPVSAGPRISKRINITMPEAVLHRVDRYVENHPGQNRSRVLTQAVERFIAAGPDRDAKKKGSRPKVKEDSRSAAKAKPRRSTSQSRRIPRKVRA